MKTCKNCNATLPDNANFCGQCGESQGIEVATMMTLSLSHISTETSGLLEQNQVNGTVAYEKRDCVGNFFGFFIYLCKEVDGPDDISACVKYAKEHGATWLQLDVDAKPIAELPTY